MRPPPAMSRSAASTLVQPPALRSCVRPCIAQRRRPRGRCASTSAQGPDAVAHPNDRPLTFDEVQSIAESRGLCIYNNPLLGFYRIVCRDKDEKGKILAVSEGFKRPLSTILHCDTLQIFTRGMGGEEGLRIRRGPLGLGLLMGAAVFTYGMSQGCRTAEILAINDDDAWATRLVRYYSYFGFRPVKEVGNGGLADVPDLLVWGGAGTRMDADINAMLTKWASAIRQQAESR